MDKKPPLDPSLLIPIFIGVFSICGILFLLLGLRLSAGRATIETVITATPLRYLYLGTEPVSALATELPAVEESTTTIAPIETPTEVFLSLPTPTQPTVATAPRTPVLLATNTPTATTVTAQPIGITYDDADNRLAYTGNWIGQTGVNGTYRNTLHISSTIGDAVQLIFYGQKIQLAYQAGPSLGTVAIRLDSSDFVLDQAALQTGFSQWESPVLTFATHTITITHISGGSINVDSLAVVDLATPTPTATPTATPTQ